MLFSFGLVLRAGFLLRVRAAYVHRSGEQRNEDGHVLQMWGNKKHDGKISRRAGVGNAAKRPGEPNFSLGAWDFCSMGLVKVGFFTSWDAVTG